MLGGVGGAVSDGRSYPDLLSFYLFYKLVIIMKKYLNSKLYDIRRWLIKVIAGDCSVIVNVDFYGKAEMKGFWLLTHNVLAQEPTYETPKSERSHNSNDESLYKMDN